MTKRSEQGFVFLTLLVFIQILCLLSLSGFMNVSLLASSHIRAWQSVEFAGRAKQVLRVLEENNVVDDMACHIPMMSAAELAQKPLSWWASHFCHGNLHQIRYYYAVESLGADPCGIVYKNNDNHPFVAHFYRISLLALPEKDSVATIRMQSTIVTPTEATTKCPHHSYPVMIGRQMWRELV